MRYVLDQLSGPATKSEMLLGLSEARQRSFRTLRGLFKVLQLHWDAHDKEASCLTNRVDQDQALMKNTRVSRVMVPAERACGSQMASFVFLRVAWVSKF